MNDGASAIFVAIQEGFDEIVHELILAGAKLNGVMLDGRTPLWIAVVEKRTKILRRLITAGADVHQEICPPRSSLIETALISGNIKLVLALVISGAELPLLLSVSKLTLLVHAIRHGHSDIVALLLTLDVTTKSNLYQLTHPLSEAVIINRLDILMMLLRYGINIHEGDYESGCSPLAYAAGLGRDVMVKKLISAGANVNHQDFHGVTCLHEAVKKNMISTMRLLIKGGANVNIGDIDNNTALKIAVMNNSVDGVKLLIKYGAMINNLPGDEHNDTALVLAIKNNNEQLVQILISANANVNNIVGGQMHPIQHAASLGYIEIVRYLIEAGVNIEAVNQDKQSALVIAANKGHAKIVRALLDANARLGFDMKNLSLEGLHIIIKTLNEIRLDSAKTIVNQSIRNPSSFFSTIDPDVTRSILKMVLERPVLRDETLLDQAWKFLTITIFFRDCYNDRNTSVQVKVNATVGSQKRAIAMQLYGISDISNLVLQGFQSNLKTLQEVNLSDCSTVRGYCKY